MSDSWAPNPGYCAQQLLWMHNVSIMHYITIQNPLTLIMCCTDIGNTAEHRILMPQPLKLHSEDHLESSPSPKVSVFTQSLLWKCTQRIILCPVIVTFSPRTILQPKVPLESPPPQSVRIYSMPNPCKRGFGKRFYMEKYVNCWEQGQRWNMAGMGERFKVLILLGFLTCKDEQHCQGRKHPGSSIAQGRHRQLLEAILLKKILWYSALQRSRQFLFLGHLWVSYGLLAWDT